MSRVRGKDTTPEMALRKAVHATGCRYRTHPKKVPGRPDIAHSGAKVAVFVDGCFWHGCPRHYKRPKSNQEFWDWKLAYNKDLRERVLRRLDADGWEVLEFWECDIKEDVPRIALQIANRIRKRAP